MIAVANHFMLTVVFIGAGYIKGFEETDAIGMEGFAHQIYGFTTTDQVAFLLLIFTIAMLVLLLVVLLYIVAREGHLPKIRLMGTGKPPELTLLKGQRFHLFNSHI